MTDDPFADPRLAGLYDQDNPPGEDHDYFRRLADEAGARVIVDLGCGTGSLTVTLSGPSRSVYGIDPSAAMLEIARHRDGGDRVTWRLGDASVIKELLPAGSADLVIMSGNTAQHIVGPDWGDALRAISSRLRRNGVLTFETRNPASRAWESWGEKQTRGTRDTPYGRLTEWLEVRDVSEFLGAAGGNVRFAAHNVFQANDEHLTFDSTLAFRTPDELAADLAAAGLRLESIEGGWHGEPATRSSRLFVVRAVSPG